MQEIHEVKIKIETDMSKIRVISIKDKEKKALMKKLDCDALMPEIEEIKRLFEIKVAGRSQKKGRNLVQEHSIFQQHNWFKQPQWTLSKSPARNGRL